MLFQITKPDTTASTQDTKESHLSLLGLVAPVLGEEVGEDVAAAAGDVHEGAFLAQAQPRRHRQHHAHRLDQQRPLAQVAPDDEAAQDGLDLLEQDEL